MSIRQFGAEVSHWGVLADVVAATWRAKQLEYAWTVSLAGAHVDFWTCTVAALDYALALHGVDASLRDDLLEAYQSLDPFADAAPTLQSLRGSGIRTTVLSNGTSRMLGEALRAAGLVDFLNACLSIEEVGVYKPATVAYKLAATRLGLAEQSIGAGVETDFMFNHGIEMREFAAHNLLPDPKGVRRWPDIFEGFLNLASEQGTGFILDTVTWKAHRHCAEKLSASEPELKAANEECVQFINELRARFYKNAQPIVLNGVIGPRGDA